MAEIVVAARGRLGDHAEAVAAHAALRSARDLGMRYPLADALEAVAMVADRTGATTSDLAVLMAPAVGLRRRGERPPPVPLAAAVAAVTARAGDPSPVDSADAVAAATALAPRMLIDARPVS